jgi:NAD(P)-dependent dehydrogenase (short-subunit alcohol dehydrogenase family)
MNRTTLLVTLALIILAVGGALGASALQTAPAGPGAESKGTVLVTGANRGIGLALAKRYLADGYAVIGTARKPDEAKELKEAGATVIALDVTDAASVKVLVEALKGRPIDILFNNAGVAEQSGRGGLAELDLGSVAKTLEVNTIGPMRVTQALLPNLRAGKGKTVVSISSGLGSIGDNSGGGYYGYRESKAALNMFMRSLAAEFRNDGFLCVAMSPGWVRTDMGGAQAPLSPEASAAGIAKTVAGLTPKESGSFVSHEGKTLPW